MATIEYLDSYFYGIAFHEVVLYVLHSVSSLSLCEPAGDHEEYQNTVIGENDGHLVSDSHLL